MLSAIAYIIATGVLVRASGWGPESEAIGKSWPKWKLWLSEFLSDYTCAAIFGIISAVLFTPVVGIACAAAFVAYRVPAFHGWQNWRNMYIRGLWTSAIGFAIIGIAAHANPYYALFAVPFAVPYMFTYAGGYKWLPYNFFGIQLHVWIEQVSGWLLAISILLIAS